MKPAGGVSLREVGESDIYINEGACEAEGTKPRAGLHRSQVLYQSPSQSSPQWSPGLPVQQESRPGRGWPGPPSAQAEKAPHSQLKVGCPLPAAMLTMAAWDADSEGPDSGGGGPGGTCAFSGWARAVAAQRSRRRPAACQCAPSCTPVRTRAVLTPYAAGPAAH
jgi:hypothetical protein